MESKMEVTKNTFIWHGNFVEDMPAITIDGVVYDARDIAQQMGVKAKWRNENESMEQTDESGDLHSPSRGISESEG